MSTAPLRERELSDAILNYQTALPIHDRRGDIVTAIRAHQVVIIAGETGSGKTTQLPKMCLEAGLGKKGQIGCTQPRRIAALSVSRRIAEELGVQWGSDVGCKIRFGDHTSRDTVIKVMTDGILLAEIRSDPLLRRYEAIIIDEAHERSLTIDFLLGYLKNILPRRSDLKVIVTSATIDTKLFSEAFGGAPIFEVSGRLYPVEIRYHGDDETDDDTETTTYVDAAVAAVESLTAESHEGDMLVFMPTERDIRETCERLSGRFGKTAQVLPLVGSLSAAEQENVFKPATLRRIVVATNIAETSLTIPNIRYVVDTGLARISRYDARARTKRLPIERIAKSSANQRSGRAGRVREGVCVRLFTDEEFTNRPDFSEPEIKRANLAEVILRMKAFNLGAIEEFPFLEPPMPRAVRAGYALLQELGALDSDGNLTSIGRELAELPVDPTIGRMLLEARRERALPEVLVIAAGLSIQDPRERPLEKRDKADEAHRRFAHPDSDFLTLLGIWNAFHAEGERTKSQGQLRKFCKAHFLSYVRMREWIDIHGEFGSALRTDKAEKHTPSSGTGARPASSIKKFDGHYRTIHRSVLAGHLGQIAYRVDRNVYRASADRQFSIFPGSALIEKQTDRRSDGDKNRSRKDPQKERWIVAAEIVETSRLFGRTAAPVDPSWIEDLGKHLCRRAISDAHYDETSETVVAKERVTLNGLTLAFRRVNLARIDPSEAKEIFIRSALLPENSRIEHDFVAENRRLCDDIGSRLARQGRFDRNALEESLVQFYSSRLPNISSSRELTRFIDEDRTRAETLLRATEKDLSNQEVPVDDESLFPKSINVSGAELRLLYKYDPGGSRDGVTVVIPSAIAPHMPPELLDGIVPGLREQQVGYLLRSLPKEYRVQCGPIDAAARTIARDADFVRRPLLPGLGAAVKQHFDVELPLSLLRMENLPDHLRPRVEVHESGSVIASTRDTRTISDTVPRGRGTRELDEWTAARNRWERSDVDDWTGLELPESVEVTHVAGVALLGFPGFKKEGDTVAVRLFEDLETALRDSRQGIDQLLERKLAKEFRDLEKQSRDTDRLKPLLLLFSNLDNFRVTAYEAARAFALRRDEPMIRSGTGLDNALATARARLPNLMPKIVTWAAAALEGRKAALNVKKQYPGMRDELDALLPVDFLCVTPFEQLEHLPRFLKAIVIRAQRADSDPARDRTKASQVAPFVARLRTLPPSPQTDHLRWMIEELKVSVFAQELGTAYSVSPTRMEKAFQECAPSSR